MEKLLFAALALIALVPGFAWADDWKDESGHVPPAISRRLIEHSITRGDEPTSLQRNESMLALRANASYF